MPRKPQLLKQSDCDRIEAAVRAAELRTAGEIVPALARRSARYGHAPWLAGALLLAALEGSGFSPGRALLPWGHWAWWLLDLLAAGLGGWLLGLWPALRRALTPPRDRRLAVRLAAEAAFRRLGLEGARGQAGVLIYVSLQEREAVVLAGRGIAELAGPQAWDEVCRLLLQGAARRDLAGGFEAAIAQAAAVLAPHHPAGPLPSALRDRLRILNEEI